MSNILNIDCMCIASESSSLYFSVPLFNDIHVMQADTFDSAIKSMYYGNEVDLSFWGMLGISMDSGKTYTTTYGLVTGYKYTYYATDNKFIILNADGKQVFTNDDILGINDFCINIDVISSNQFTIVFSPFSNLYSFYKIANMVDVNSWTGFMNDVGYDGVQNILLPDRVRPYGKDDPDNPIWNISNLGSDNTLFTVEDYIISLFVSGDTSWFLNNGINYDNTVCSNNFYTDLDSYIVDVKLSAKEYTSYMLSLSLILPDLSNSLYPHLLPIESTDETMNNRPVYEPWMIWKILEFITTKITTDDTGDKDFEVYSFDLSPVYS